MDLDQKAHEFALAFASSEFRRISEYELKTYPHDVDVDSDSASLAIFKELYNDAYTEFF